MDINKCKEWKLNKTINPMTNRKIKIEGPTYKKLQNLCKIYQKISFYKSSLKSSLSSLLSTTSSSSVSSSLIDSSVVYSLFSNINKSLKEQIINIIKIRRKKNLLIINNFLNQKFKIDGDNNCLTIKKNKLYINNIIKLNNIIGIGGYGISYLLKYINEEKKEIIKYVIKLTVINKKENLHEIRILELLTKYAINYEFPHFPMTYDILYCNNDKLNSSLIKKIKYIDDDIYNILNKYSGKGDILFIVNEYVDGGDLRTFNRFITNKYNYENIQKYFLNAISQILISLMFYHKLVNSNHCDLHQHNVLNHLTEPGGYFHYKLYEKDYYIENIGYIWVIWDFGLSVPFDNSLQINKLREEELKNHIFNYLKKTNEYNNLSSYLGRDKKDSREHFLYDENNNKYLIKKDNILFDLIFLSDSKSPYCIYSYYLKNNINEYPFIAKLINTFNSDVVHKCLKLNLRAYDLPIMDNLIIEWMLKMNLLLTELPLNAKIINKDNPYILS